MQKGCLSVLILATLSVLSGMRELPAAEKMNYSKFMALPSEEQESYSKSKAKKFGNYFTCKLGRYNINAEGSPAAAIRWALLLDAFTDEILDERIVPPKKIIPGDPQVFILNSRASYQNALNSFAQSQLDAGWSVGMFMRYGNKAGLFGYDYSSERKKSDKSSTQKNKNDKEKDSGKEEEDKKDVLESTLLHECTHQMVFYHLGTSAPLWFNEGIATNLETYDCDMDMKANLYNAMYMNNRADGAAILNRDGKLKPFQNLFTITSEEWHNASSDEAQINYCSAWAACNFFFTCRKGRKFVGKLMDTIKKNHGKQGGQDIVAKMLNSKDLQEIDTLIKEHVASTLLPTCKYGRSIRKLLNDGKKDEATKYVEAMAKEFPENNELKFYRAWLDILNGKEPEAAAAAINKLLQTTDFNHPEANYVLTLSYQKAGNKQMAKAQLSKALKNNAAHKGTLALQDELK